MGQPTAEWLERRYGARLQWLPFDLHPEYPPEGIPREQLHERYGEPLHARIREMFEAARLEYQPPRDVVPNSRTALRLTELARDVGHHRAFHDRVMDAYWADGRNIGDPAELRGLATEVGLSSDDVERVLAGDEYVDRVQRSTFQAASLGVSGIPAFLLDRRLLVLGAQSREAFEEAVAKLETVS